MSVPKDKEVIFKQMKYGRRGKRTKKCYTYLKLISDRKPLDL